MKRDHFDQLIEELEGALRTLRRANTSHDPTGAMDCEQSIEQAIDSAKRLKRLRRTPDEPVEPV